MTKKRTVDPKYRCEPEQLSDSKIDSYYGSIQDGRGDQEAVVALMGHYVAAIDAAHGSALPIKLSARAQEIYTEWLGTAFKKMLEGKTADEALGLSMPAHRPTDPRTRNRDFVLAVKIHSLVHENAEITTGASGIKITGKRGVQKHAARQIRSESKEKLPALTVDRLEKIYRHFRDEISDLAAKQPNTYRTLAKIAYEELLENPPEKKNIK